MKEMNAKDKARQKILEYLGNPDNEFPTRKYLAKEVLGYAHRQAINKTFTADELREIEFEALEIRRKNYAPELSKVDKALIQAAQNGDVSAAKLVYQKFEGWSEKRKHELTGKDGQPLGGGITSLPPEPETLEEWIEFVKKIDSIVKPEENERQ